MSELTIKLIIILIPGAMATLVFGKLILHKDWNNFRFVLYSVLFGISSYVVLQLLIDLINVFKSTKWDDLTIWNSLTSANDIPYKEVVFTSFVSFTLAFIMSALENKKVIHKIASLLRVSNKRGDENLYSRFLNSKKVEYVYLRDIKNGLTYYGWVKSFSESETVSELRLAEVSVYEYSDSTLLYEVGEVYLSFDKRNVIIELAKPV